MPFSCALVRPICKLRRTLVGCGVDARMSAPTCPPKLLPVLEKPADPSTKSFFSEIVASISDIKSTPDGRYIVSRDFMTLKLWDVNMEARPVKTINVHEHLRPQVSPNCKSPINGVGRERPYESTLHEILHWPLGTLWGTSKRGYLTFPHAYSKIMQCCALPHEGENPVLSNQEAQTRPFPSQLCDLYDNDCIFDKFECAVNGDASNVLTGSYGNMCHMYDRFGQTKGSFEVRTVHSEQLGPDALRALCSIWRNLGLGLSIRIQRIFGMRMLIG